MMKADLFYQITKTQLLELYFNVINGDDQALDTYAHLKQLKGLFDKLLPQLEATAIREASTYGEDTFRKSGFEYHVRQGNRRFTYNHIPKWNQQRKVLKDIEDTHKQAFIAKEKGMLTATEDGEEIILPKVHYNKGSLIVRALKESTAQNAEA